MKEIMVDKFVNVGFDNMVNISKITFVANTNNNPARRLVHQNKQNGTFYDMTLNRVGKSIVMTDKGIILSSLSPKTIIRRVNNPSGNK